MARSKPAPWSSVTRRIGDLVTVPYPRWTAWCRSRSGVVAPRGVGGLDAFRAAVPHVTPDLLGRTGVQAAPRHPSRGCAASGPVSTCPWRTGTFSEMDNSVDLATPNREDSSDPSGCGGCCPPSWYRREA